jgi:hypothetical protein
VVVTVASQVSTSLYYNFDGTSLYLSIRMLSVARIERQGAPRVAASLLLRYCLLRLSRFLAVLQLVTLSLCPVCAAPVIGSVTPAANALVGSTITLLGSVSGSAQLLPASPAALPLSSLHLHRLTVPVAVGPCLSLCTPRRLSPD